MLELDSDDATRGRKRQPGRDEGQQTRPDIDVWLASEVVKELDPAQIAVAVLGTLDRPGAVGDHFPIQRHRERAGSLADHLGRIPVGHVAEPRRQAQQCRLSIALLGLQPVGARVDCSANRSISIWGRRLAQDERPDLQEVGTVVSIEKKLEVYLVAAGGILHRFDGAHELPNQRRTDRLGSSVRQVPGLGRATA